MTSIAAVAVNDIEIQTLEARSLTHKIRRGLDGSRAYLGALFYGRQLAKDLRLIVSGLREACRDGFIDTIPEEEFQELTSDLEKLYVGVRVVCLAARAAGIHTLPLHRRYFDRIERISGDLESILESFRLASSEDFQRMTLQAVDGLP